MLAVGGGTAGLTLAARLSENPAVTVCVLEGGDSNINDPDLRESSPILLCLCEADLCSQ